MSQEDATETRSLWGALIVCSLVILAAGYLLSRGLLDLPNERISDGLSGVATTGGIVSGLSLSGTAILSLNGEFRRRVLARYGRIIRGIFFGGYALVVCVSLLCALATIWIEQTWVRYALGYSVPIIVIIAVATALLVNNAFAVDDKPRRKVTKGPY